MLRLIGNLKRRHDERENNYRRQCIDEKQPRQLRLYDVGEPSPGRGRICCHRVGGRKVSRWIALFEQRTHVLRDAKSGQTVDRANPRRGWGRRRYFSELCSIATSRTEALPAHESSSSLAQASR